MNSGVYPYIILNGNGKEAIKFYEQALEAEVLGISTYGELPQSPDYPLPEEAKDLIVHANLKIGESYLMISDEFPGQPYVLGNQVNVALILKDRNKTKELFAKLQEGGEVIMPLQETPWSPAYGQIKDKFNITWQVSIVEE